MSKKYLEELYYDPKSPGSYGGITSLWNAVKADGNPYKLKHKDVKKWLSEEETYTLHKPYKDKFKRESIIVGKIGEQWDTDLMVFDKISQYNKGYKYLAVFIDLFSRYLWIQPLKTKTPDEMVQVMKKVFATTKKPQTIRSDQGKEYTGKKIQAFFQENGIHHIIAYNVYHANYAERVIRTIKGKIFRYFTKHQTLNYIDHIQDIVSSYNSSRHSFLKMAPDQVTEENQQELYEKLYLPTELKRERTPVTYKFKVGDKVRIATERRPFKKGYEQVWTDEIFVVDKTIPSHPARYKLSDLNGEEIKSSFYAQELQLAHDDGVYKVEKILRYRRRKGVREALIRWKGYGKKFDSWVDTKELR